MKSADEPKVSVVVPVYNVELYLERCLNSLVRQSLDSFEIVVVNDGSPDGSQGIIDRFAREHPALMRCFIKENGGLSDARNYGVEHARGSYLAFVDSDDRVERSFLEELYGKALEDDADVVCCGMAFEFDDKIEKAFLESDVFGKNVREEPEILVCANSYACNKLYRREFWRENGFEFPVGQCFEDSALIYNVMLAANKVSCVNFPLYYYRHDRDASITRVHGEHLFDALKSVNSIVSYFKEHNAFNQMNEVVEYLVLRHSLARLKVMLGNSDKKMARRYVDELAAFLNTEFPNWRKNRYINPENAPSRTRIHKYVQRSTRRTKFVLSLPASIIDAAYGLHDTAAWGKGKISQKLNEDRARQEKWRNTRESGLRAIQDIQQVLQDMGLQSFADTETLLGLVREGRLRECDSDVNMGVIADSDRKDEIRFLLEKKGYRLSRQYLYKGSVAGESYHYQGAKVNLSYYEMGLNHACTWLLYKKPRYRYEKSNLRHVVRMDYELTGEVHMREFDGVRIFVPDDSEQLLNQMFGESWRTFNTEWRYWQSPAAAPLNELGYYISYSYRDSVA